MNNASEMKILSEAEADLVSGGTSVPVDDGGIREYWQRELLRYQMGQSSIFGEGQ